MRKYLIKIVEHPYFYTTIVALILFNSIILGLQTYPSVTAKIGPFPTALDSVMIAIFICELLAYLVILGPKKCLTDPWYIFDAFVILIAVFSFNSAYSSLRAMHALRILRLVTVFPNLRKVVQALIYSLPGIGSIATIIIILVYVADLMATNMFSAEFPENFGNLQITALTLFQLMIFDDAGAIIRQALQTHLYAWIFFVTYLFAATFTVLNLFIAVMVDAMQKNVMDEKNEEEFKALFEINSRIDKITKKIDNKINMLD